MSLTSFNVNPISSHISAVGSKPFCQSSTCIRFFKVLAIQQLRFISSCKNPLTPNSGAATGFGGTSVSPLATASRCATRCEYRSKTTSIIRSSIGSSASALPTKLANAPIRFFLPLTLVTAASRNEY